jgi:hypothetical protein
MPEVRQRFHEELRAVEGEVQQTGAQARLLLEKALGSTCQRRLWALRGGHPRR